MEARFSALLDTPLFGTGELALLACVCERTALRFLRARDKAHHGPWRLTRRQLLAYARELEARKTKRCRV